MSHVPCADIESPHAVEDTQDFSSPRDACRTTLPNDLPRRRTFNFEQFKGKKQRHIQGVYDDDSHQIPPARIRRNGAFLDDLPRRHTFDIESLKDRQRRQKLSGCEGENCTNIPELVNEIQAARIGGARDIDNFEEPIAEDYPLQKDGNRKDRDKRAHRRSANRWFQTGPNKEASGVKVDDFPRRRQAYFALSDGYVAENTPSVDSASPQDDSGESTSKHKLSDKAREFAIMGWAFRRAKFLQMDIPREMVLLGQDEGVHLEIFGDHTHDLSNIGQARSAESAESLKIWRRLKGIPVMSDIPRRRSMYLAKEPRGPGGKEIARCDFDFTDLNAEEDTNQQAGDRKQSVGQSTNAQANVRGIPIRLTTTALFPIDLPRPRARFQKIPIDALHPILQNDVSGMPVYNQESIDDRSVRCSRDQSRKREPFVSDFPRRRSFCVTECTNEPLITRVSSDAHGELGKDCRTPLAEHEQPDGIQNGVSDYQRSPEEESTGPIAGSDGNIAHDAQCLLHAKRDVRRGRIVSCDIPRRRAFPLDDAATKVKQEEIASSSTVCVSTHQDKNYYMEGTQYGAAAHDIGTESTRMDFHWGLNNKSIARSIHSQRAPWIDRYLGYKSREVPVMSDISRRRSLYSTK